MPVSLVAAILALCREAAADVPNLSITAAIASPPSGLLPRTPRQAIGVNSQAQCSLGETYHGGACFGQSNATMTFAAALAWCKRLAPLSKLTSLTVPSELQTILSAQNTTFNASFWLGARLAFGGPGGGQWRLASNPSEALSSTWVDADITKQHPQPLVAIQYTPTVSLLSGGLGDVHHALCETPSAAEATPPSHIAQLLPHAGTWQEAANACADQGTSLADLTFPGAQGLLQHLWGGHAPGLWLGVTRQDGMWRADSGALPHAAPAGLPDTPGDGCTWWNGTHAVLDGSCGTGRRGVCFGTRGGQADTRPRCPPGWLFDIAGDSCVAQLTGSVSLQGAIKGCAARGAGLRRWLNPHLELSAVSEQLLPVKGNTRMWSDIVKLAGDWTQVHQPEQPLPPAWSAALSLAAAAGPAAVLTGKDQAGELVAATSSSEQAANTSAVCEFFPENDPLGYGLSPEKHRCEMVGSSRGVQQLAIAQSRNVDNYCQSHNMYLSMSCRQGAFQRRR